MEAVGNIMTLLLGQTGGLGIEWPWAAGPNATVTVVERGRCDRGDPTAVTAMALDVPAGVLFHRLCFLRSLSASPERLWGKDATELSPQSADRTTKHIYSEAEVAMLIFEYANTCTGKEFSYE